IGVGSYPMWLHGGALLPSALSSVSNVTNWKRPVKIAPRPPPPQDSFGYHRRIVTRLRLFFADGATLQVRHGDFVAVEFPIALRNGARERFRRGLSLHDDLWHHTIPSLG